MSAILSPCGQYRYRLERRVGWEGPVYAFFGVNPSKADATVDDQTVTKWINFVSRWGGSRFIVGNAFAYRATNVRELARAPDPIGPDNLLHVARIVEEADILVPCWGDRGKVPPRLRGDFALLMDRLTRSGKPVKAFGRTVKGDPLHPLMLPYSTELEVLP